MKTKSELATNLLTAALDTMDLKLSQFSEGTQAYLVLREGKDNLWLPLEPACQALEEALDQALEEESSAVREDLQSQLREEVFESVLSAIQALRNREALFKG